MTSITLTPDRITLAPSAQYQFSVKGTWSDGSAGTPSVIWATNGGAVTTSGLYLAPSTQGTFRLVAYHLASGKSDTAAITVGTTSPSISSLQISPDPATVAPGKTVQFKAVAKYSNGTTGTPVVTWSETGGTISSSGLYTAGWTSGKYAVTATAGSVKDIGSVTIASATVTKLVINPTSVALTPGATKQFSATASWSDGATRAVSLTYSATGGTITSSGLFQAGTGTGTYRVIVGCASGCSLKDTSSVSIASSTVTSSSGLTLSPQNVTLDMGEVTQFTAKTSSGSTISSVTWSTTGGSFSSSGNWYRAPRTSGSYTVTAKTSSGSVSTNVTVRAPTAPYFSDTFDGCTLNKSSNALGFAWTYSSGGSSNENPAISRNVARSGSCSLRLSFAGGASGDDAWSEQRFKLGKRLTELYIRWYQYFPNGSISTIGTKYLHRNDTGPDNNKLLRFWDDDYRNFKVKLGLSTLPKSGGDSYIISEYGTVSKSVGQNGAQSDYNGIINSRRGRWVKFVVHVRLATAANNDGVLELWVDGVKTISNTTLPMYPSGGIGNFLRNGYLMGWSNSGFSSTSHTYIDDVTISGTPIS